MKTFIQFYAIIRGVLELNSRTGSEGSTKFSYVSETLIKTRKIITTTDYFEKHVCVFLVFLHIFTKMFITR